MTCKQTYDLGALAWTVAGYVPTSWTGRSMELGFALEPEIPPVPARVPGSVQGALRTAQQIPDWFIGLNARACEWVEHRDWMFSARLPDAWFTQGQRFVLNCGGLDGNGVIVFNKKQVGTFDNAFIPYQFDLTPHIQPANNELHLIFFTPPRWLGQVGYTSQMKEWKPRFYYTWDWIPRLVQIGPWEPVTLAVTEAAEIATFRCRSDWDVKGETGRLWLKGTLAATADTSTRVRLALRDGNTTLKTAELTAAEFATGVDWAALAVAPWWPNGAGPRQLYTVTCELLDAAGSCVDRQERTVGFKNVVWQDCTNAPAGADPWICVVNGRPIFLQGIDWTPIIPTFADLPRERYQRLVEQYRDFGCNIFRVWGGAFLEKSWFYDLCDQHGLLVWQEFSLCSSGHENWPHEDEPSMQTLELIAESYIVRRQHHASLLMWCGGNELQGSMDGGKVGVGLPVTRQHPLMQRWQALIDREDPGRRFVPSSASGPRFMAFANDFGKGLHWDVHGPWKVAGATPEECTAYWAKDDALFRSETGAPGASSAELIRRYSGGLPVTPGTMDNPLWRRFAWWLEWADFTKEQGHEPASLEEYVTWSQARQATALAMAIRACKARFPGIGGIILWMGHDAFPCNANTSIIDFEGNPKPAAIAAAALWQTSVETLHMNRATHQNSAILTVPNTQKDFYDWNERRAQKVAQAQSGSHDLIFIGDSITHLFEVADRGAVLWQKYYGHRRALDLGYGWDCTQNVLWRLENGEFAGQRPKLVVLTIGTNNLTGNSASRANSAAEIVAGIEAICQFIHRQSPATTILVMAVFPRGLTTDPIHTQVKELNSVLKAALTGKPRILHLDIGQRFLGADGEIPLEIMNDRCHPTEKGYAIWAEAIEAIVKQHV